MYLFSSTARQKAAGSLTRVAVARPGSRGEQVPKMFWPSTRVWRSCSEARAYRLLLVRQRVLREVVGQDFRMTSQMSGGKTPY